MGRLFSRRGSGHPRRSSADPLPRVGWFGSGADAELERLHEDRLYRRHRWRRRIRLVVGLGLAASAGLGALLIYYTIVFPDPMRLRLKEPAPTIRVLARDGSVLAERGESYDYVPLDLLPGHVANALVAVEDRRFFRHRGVDPRGLLRATFANLKARRLVQGGSTLTQQLAKNLFLTPERSLGRKFEELLLAVWLEVRLSKHDIIELYLNRVYFGTGAYGIEAAARRYFDKSARQLTLAEAALLAGLLKAPSRYSPFASPELAKSRAGVVMAAMVDAGLATADQSVRAQRQTLRFATPDHLKKPLGSEHAVDYVLERLPPLVGSGHKELIVETTLDAALQRQAHAAVERTLAVDGRRSEAGQASVVVVDRQGGIRVMIGGRDYQQSQFNRAVKARRQPGSTFKPFVFLAALEKGMTPDSMALDAPIQLDGWSPRNEGGQHRGPVPLRLALAHSINTVAVRLQQEVGATRVIAAARRLGIQSELRDAPALALGTSEVSLLELTGAYGVLANGGRRADPFIIHRVRTSGGQVLHEHKTEPGRPTVSSLHVGQMNDMLNAALVSGTGRRAGLPNHPAAGKTGTSQEHRDAWFIGYTAHLTGGVWVGNDNGRPMDKVVGGGLPSLIWRAIMVEAHRGLEPTVLPGTFQPRPADDTGDRLADAGKVALPRDRIGADFIERALRGDEQPAAGPTWTAWLARKLGFGPASRPAG